MRFDLDNLPSDIAVLHRLIRDMAAVVEHRDGEIERLRLIIGKLQRAQFGRRSERIEADQFELALDDLNTDLAAAESRDGEMEAAVELSAEAQAKRRPLPEHLRMKMWFRIPPATHARAVTGPCIVSARASARCWTGRLPSCVSYEPAVPNTGGRRIGSPKIREAIDSLVVLSLFVLRMRRTARAPEFRGQCMISAAPTSITGPRG
jgi:hypothetical protein